MGKQGIGVIGLAVGREHCKAINACSRTELVGAADLSNERCDWVRENTACTNLYCDYRELIADPKVNAISVALPIHLHHQATMAALNANKHVFCEKPPASNSDETRQMVELALERNLVLTWCLQRRFNPEMMAARHVVDSGMLGHIYRVHVRYLRDRMPRMMTEPYRMLRNSGGGVMLDLGVHALDMGWYLLGCPKPIRLVSSNYSAFPEWNAVENIEDMAEDTALAMIFFENGSTLTLEASFVSQSEDLTNHKPTVRLFGDKGGFYTDSLTVCQGGSEKMEYTSIDILPEWEGPHPRIKILENFVDAIEGKDSLIVKAEHGLHLMKMIDGIRTSWLEQREVRFDHAD